MTVDAVRSVNPLLTQPKNRVTRRRAGRIWVQGLSCDQGRVVDLSAGGARLLSRSRWAIDEVREVTFTGRDVRITLRARCAWRRRIGPLMGLLGLEFQGLNPGQGATLSGLARANSLEIRLAQCRGGATITDADFEAQGVQPAGGRLDPGPAASASPESAGNEPDVERGRAKDR